MADALHEYIIKSYRAYANEPGRKVLFGCIKWTGDSAPEVEGLNYSYTEVHKHYYASVMEQMRIAARGACEERRTRRNLDCTCQPVDENNQNFIAVP